MQLDSVGAEACFRLLQYIDELKRWNQKINIIARQTDDLQIIENHFLDSLTLLPLLKRWSQPTLLDIGTGGGFPGLVLKAAYPSLAVTLVEPREKRVSFLKHIVRNLNLEEVEIISGRIEKRQPLPKALQNRKFDLVTSRALTDAATFLSMAEPFCSPGGIGVCMKGPKKEKELEIIRNNNRKENSLRLLDSIEWRLPFSGKSRYLLLFGAINN